MISFCSKIVDNIRTRAARSPLLRWTLHMVVLLMILGVGGLLVAVSGIIPIKASSGHWAITHAFLHFAKQRSVSTHTVGITPPLLDDPALVLKGAGHYEIGCRACHGSPELRHPKIARHMLPAPPYLPETAPNWRSEELFYMVKHGIKFTGMPAWPAQQRDDEVWAVVAFLRAFPDLDAAAYRRLVDGETAPKKSASQLSDLESEPAATALTKSCNACHGLDGQGRENGAFPKLAGQHPEYLIASMEAFARGERHSGIMEPIAVSLLPDVAATEMPQTNTEHGANPTPARKKTRSSQLEALARHYANLKTTAASVQANQKSIQRGEVIAKKGIPSQEVPACIDCHDSGNAPMNPLYPSLDSQHGDYIVLQLTLFKAGHRGGTSHAHLMRKIAVELKDEQMRDVASYFASRKLRRSIAVGTND